MTKNGKKLLWIIAGFLIIGGGYVFFVEPYILSVTPAQSETKNPEPQAVVVADQINAVSLGFDGQQEAPAGMPQLSYVNGVLNYQYSECNRAPEAIYCNGSKEIIASDQLFQKYGAQLKDQNFQLHKLSLNQQDYPEKIIFQQKDFKGEIRAGKYQNSGDQIVFDLPTDEQGIMIRLSEDIWLKNANRLASGSLLWIQKNAISVAPRYYQAIFSHQDTGARQDFSRASMSQPTAQIIDFSTPAAHSDQTVVQKKIDQYGQSSFAYGSNRSTVVFGRETKVSNTHNLNLIGSNGVITFVGHARSSAAPKISINDFLGNQLSPNSYKISSSGNNLLISFKNLPSKGKFVIRLQDETQDFMVKFGTFSPFEQTIEKNITKIDKLVEDYSDGNYRQVKKTVSVNNFHLCFNQPLDQKSVRNAFAKSFSSGSYSLVFSQTNEDYMDSENNDFCLMFYYYLDPEKNHTFDLQNIQSIFGEKLSTKIQIPKHELPDEHQFATVAGNTVNVLPKNGYLGDKIQVAYKNIKKIDLDYRTCRLLKDPTAIEAKLRKNKPGAQRDILFSFIDCDAQKSQQITFPNFQRRSNKVLDYPIAKLFGATVPSLFWIGVDSSLDKSQGKFFQRTNIGLIGKYAQGKLFVWSHDLVNGKPIKNISLMLNYFDSATKKWVSVSQTGAQGATIFSIPVADDFINGFLIAKTADDEAFMMLQDLYFEYNPDSTLENYQQGASYNNSFAIDSWQIGAGRSWESPYGLRLYAYTDRALYKPGDDVFVSGWLRRQSRQGTLVTGAIEITANDAQGQQVYSTSLAKVDEFGGFKASFKLPKTANLGGYSISYSYTDLASKNQQSTYYSSYFRVDEYKKNSFSVRSKFVEIKDKSRYLRLEPYYYFGGDLKKYSAQLQYSLLATNYGYRDWESCGQMRCNEPIYYAKIWGAGISSGGSLSLKDYQKKYFDIDLKKIQANMPATLAIDATIVDAQTQEVVSRSIVEKIYPDYLVGIKGYDYNWKDAADKKISVKGKTLKFKSDDASDLQNYQPNSDGGEVKALIYYKDYSVQSELGPDGERYFADGAKFQKIQEKSIKLASDGSFDLLFDAPKVGSYFIRFIYKDSFEVNHQVNLYATDGISPRFYGEMSNNFALSVYARDKNYKDGEKVEVNIEPYIKGATVLVSVEKEGEVLWSEEKILDGSLIQVPVSKKWYPNAHISVVQIVGESINKDISLNRKEPRFFIGYTNVKLAPEMMKINYAVKITTEDGKQLDRYEPRQKIKVAIKATNYLGQPVKTRMSIGIVDKALIDLYDEIKRPLETFYMFTNPGFRIVANYKVLYKALRVFATDGTKGGGGGGNPGGPINLANPRKNFFDVAYRRGGEITNEKGELEFTTQLPDNLTTRMVELIGVTKNGEMGTSRSFFKVGKDVILLPNLPKFIAMGDSITVPIGIISEKSTTNIVPKGFMSIGVNKIPLVITKTDNNFFFQLDTNGLDQSELIKNEMLTVTLEAPGADAVEMQIPIRKEGSTAATYKNFYSAKLKDKILLSGGSVVANIKVTVSNLPISTVENAIRYLMRYPYGCVEQKLSGLYPLLIAKSLAQRGFISKDLINGDQVYLQRYEDSVGEVVARRFSLKDLVQEVLLGIYSKQQPSGLFGYRGYVGEIPNYELSVYVYQVLSSVKKLGYTVDQKVFDRLTTALTSTPPNSSRLTLYVSMVKAMNGLPVDLNRVKEIVAQDPKNMVHKVYAYAIFVYNGQKADELKKELITYFRNNFTQPAGYGPYTNLNILKAIFVRSLVKNGTIDEATPYIIEFHKSVNEYGYRSRSTQENIQIILAMADFMNSRNKKAEYTFDGTIGGQKIAGKLTQDIVSKTMNFTAKDISDLDIDFTSSDKLLIDVDVNFVPKDKSALSDELHEMSQLSFDVDDKKISALQIGEKTKATGLFRTKKGSNQVAVSFNIPANTTIINPALGQSSYQSQSEDYSSRYDYFNFKSIGRVHSWYNCTPSHQEIRFDRLFLYYENLPAGAGCTVTFELMKTHIGISNPIKAQFFEMYDTNVRGIDY